MKGKILNLAFLGVMTISCCAMAKDSGRDSAASLAAVSVAPASIAVVSAYVGGVMVVESVRTVGEMFEVVFKGAGAASQAVLTLTADSVKASGLAVGQSVKVVAEGTGYLLIVSGKALCFVSGDEEQSLVRSTRSS